MLVFTIFDHKKKILWILYKMFYVLAASNPNQQSYESSTRTVACFGVTIISVNVFDRVS